MTDALERVFRLAERLPEKEQRELAQMIEQKLADMRWEDLLQLPESNLFLRDLEREAEDQSTLEDLETVL